MCAGTWSLTRDPAGGGGVLPLTLALLALLALLLVGLGDLWLWAAQLAFVWLPAVAAAPLLCTRVRSCQAVMALQCAHARGGVQSGQALALTYSGVQSCQAPALACAGVRSYQTPALTGAGVRSGQAPAPTCARGCGADRVDRARVTAWRRTLLSGDVHPHPGLLRTAIVNATSLRLHMDEVTSWGVEVIVVQETKPSASRQRVLRGALRQRGWMVLWGAPVETRGRGMWDVREGVVAVLVRDRHAAEAAELPKTR